MLTLMFVIGLAAAVAEPAPTEAPRADPIRRLGTTAKGFFDLGVTAAGIAVGPSRKAASPQKPECAIRVQRADPAVDAAMARDVTPQVDVAMAMPGSCTAKAAE